MSAPGYKQKLKKNSRNDWRTPFKFYNGLQKFLNLEFKLDAAADAENHLASSWYDEKSNGLMSPWITYTFCNPPYDITEQFLTKAYNEFIHRGIASCLLVPSATDTQWFFDAEERASHVILLKGRIPFNHPETNAPFYIDAEGIKKGMANPTGSSLFLFGEFKTLQNESSKILLLDWKQKFITIGS